MIVRRHFEDVEGAWPIRRSRESVDPEGDLREAAAKQGAAIVEDKTTAVTEEKPRLRSTE